MSIRVSLALTLPLALALAGCTDEVTEVNRAPFARAVFDPDAPSIPTPNDLALQAAPGVTDPATRGALFAIINQGGFSSVPSTTPGTLGSLSVIRIPYEVVTAGVGAAPTAGLIDTATVKGRTSATAQDGTVAIVRVSGAGAPEVFAPAVLQDTPGALLMLPVVGAAPGGYVPGTRYVVAVRGGPNGVKATDGGALAASSPIALVTNPDVDLDHPDARPASVTEEQAADLSTLRLVFAAPLNWMRVPSDAICRGALGIPAGAPFPEGVCWLPDPAGDPGVTPAFNAVDLVFPVREAASIQTFEIAP